MSGLKTIRRRITSVKNTRQITRAMKLVSAAKLRRAQDAATGGRAFGDELQDLLRTVTKAVPESFSHPLLEPRSVVKNRLVLVVAGERGLCGAYNANVLKAVTAQEQPSQSSPDLNVAVLPIGKQARSAAKRFGWTISVEPEAWAKEGAVGEDANRWPAQEMAEWLISAYSSGEFDEVVIYYTKFISAMTQVVTKEVLLPLAPVAVHTGDEDEAAASAAASASSELAANNAAAQTLFDPSPELLLIKLFSFLLATKIRQAGLEAKASEHSSRMTAMDSATRNADDLIDKLKLFYNRARQSAITRELIDIVGGAEAVK
jgi:F-type H+-transporting ATPase subunit gamma